MTLVRRSRVTSGSRIVWGLTGMVAEVGLKDSRTYGTHAWNDSPHAGNANWTAYSDYFYCQFQFHREWQTLGYNTYYAVDGESSLWAMVGAWSPGVDC